MSNLRTDNGHSIPHGGALIDRYIPADAAGANRGSAPSIRLDEVASCDLRMIAEGGLSPLTGFMARDDYDSVVGEMRLANDLPWSIPITLPVSQETAKRLTAGQTASLRDERDEVVGTIAVSAIWQPDLEREAKQVYGTAERAHPGVARLFERGDWYVGGQVSVFAGAFDRSQNGRDLSPRAARAAFAERGWRRIVAFQTRNPIHRAHEYIQKCALETVDGLLIHPLVGRTKGDDIPADVRLQSYEALVSSYYPANRVVLSVFPAAMRYAGPREAIFHAIARKNYGCTHFIVGRDHAGVGNYYDPYDAHRIFDRFEPADLGITPLFFDNTFYCNRCDAIVSQKTCPHDASAHLVFSGTQIRDMLRRGERLPAHYSRPEVVDVLVAALSENGHTPHV